MKAMIRIAAAALALCAFALIAAHLRLPNASTAWRIAPRAQTRQEERMSVPMPQGPVNVNTASREELETLNGIGPALAESIITERTENGRFHYPQDLLCVRGIGEKTLLKLLDGICIP